MSQSSDEPPTPAQSASDGAEESGGLIDTDWSFDPGGFVKRFANSSPSVDIDSLAAQAGSYRRAHGIAFVKKFLGADGEGLPAAGHLVMALLPGKGGGNSGSD